MDNQEQDFAQVGDTIEITIKKTPLFGKQFVVVLAPEITERIPEEGDVWILNDLNSGLPGFIRFRHYKIVKRSARQDTKSVDAFLRKQIDDNLSGIFC